jgi:hypothetical protein
MSQRPESIRRLTQSYGDLRGLAYLPFLLWFLVNHSAELIGVRLWPITLPLLAIVSVAAASAIYRYYDRRFGVVTRPMRWGGSTLALVLIAFVTLEATSAYLAFPVHLGFFAIGIAIAVHALRHFELEGHRLLAAVPFLAISFWGRSIFDPPVPKGPGYYAAAVAFDAIWIMVALLDHRTLVNAFERAHLANTGEAPSSIR